MDDEGGYGYYREHGRGRKRSRSRSRSVSRSPRRVRSRSRSASPSNRYYRPTREASEGRPAKRRRAESPIDDRYRDPRNRYDRERHWSRSPPRSHFRPDRGRSPVRSGGEFRRDERYVQPGYAPPSDYAVPMMAGDSTRDWHYNAVSNQPPPRSWPSEPNENQYTVNPPMPPSGVPESDIPPKGRRGAQPGQLKPRDPTGTSLVISHIPDELNTQEKLYGYFSKFGTIVNLRIEPEKQRALLKFAEPSSASKAIRSEEAVLGNRFIRVLWSYTDIGIDPEWKPPIKTTPGVPVRVSPVVGTTKLENPELIQKRKEAQENAKRQIDELKRKHIEALHRQRDLLEKLTTKSKSPDLSPKDKAALGQQIQKLIDAMKATLAAKNKLDAVGMSTSAVSTTPTSKLRQSRDSIPQKQVSTQAVQPQNGGVQANGKQTTNWAATKPSPQSTPTQTSTPTVRKVAADAQTAPQPEKDEVTEEIYHQPDAVPYLVFEEDDS